MEVSMLRRVATLLFVLSMTPFGFASMTQAAGNSYYFTGKEFLEGLSPGAVSVNVQDGYLPFVQAGEGIPRIAKLPEGTGGLALFCFVQSAGGKLKSGNGYLPISGAPVEIVGGGLKLAVRADENGYVVLALPPGQYEVRLPGFSRKVKLEKGRNALVAIRGGKRMVD
jgi:hypothetical protein